jgi:hypothetical protein
MRLKTTIDSRLLLFFIRLFIYYKQGYGAIILEKTPGKNIS